jgi:hypothetical protein
VLTNGGRGVILIELEPKDETLLVAQPITQKGVQIVGTTRFPRRRGTLCGRRAYRIFSACGAR